MCLGVLPKEKEHDDLLNNLCFCQAQVDEGEEIEHGPDPDWEVNLEDIILLKRLFQAGIEHVLANNLYRPPGFGDSYGLPEAREFKKEGV